MRTQPLPKNGTGPLIFGLCLLRPNGCMDHDAAWYGGRPRPQRYCVGWTPSSPSPKKGGRAPFPVFSPRLLWPNCCTDQDATWYGGRPRPRRLRVRWGPSYRQKNGHTHPTYWIKMSLGTEVNLLDGIAAPLKGAQPQFSVHVYCGQTAGWMTTPLGTEVYLGPGHIVLDVVPALRERAHSCPLLFRPCLLWP